MTCDEAMRTLLLRDSGEASPAECAALTEHLAACDACRAEAESVRAGLSLYRDTRRPVVPSGRADLLRRAPQPAAHAAAQPPRRRILPFAAPALATAAAALIVVGLHLFGDPTGPARPDPAPGATAQTPGATAQTPVAAGRPGAVAAAPDALDLPDEAPVTDAFLSAAEADLDRIDALLSYAGGPQPVVENEDTDDKTEEAVLRTVDQFMDALDGVGLGADA